MCVIERVEHPRRTALENRNPLPKSFAAFSSGALGKMPGLSHSYSRVDSRDKKHIGWKTQRRKSVSGGYILKIMFEP